MYHLKCAKFAGADTLRETDTETEKEKISPDLKQSGSKSNI